MRPHFGKSFVLVPIGLFFIALTLILSREIVMPDVIKGFSLGIGIGLMILAFIFRKIRSVHHQ